MTEYLHVDGVCDRCRGGAPHRAVVRVEQLGLRLRHGLGPVLLLGHGAAAAVVELILQIQMQMQMCRANDSRPRTTVPLNCCCIYICIYINSDISCACRLWSSSDNASFCRFVAPSACHSWRRVHMGGLTLTLATLTLYRCGRRLELLPPPASYCFYLLPHLQQSHRPGAQ